MDEGNTHEEILNILRERGYDGSRSLISSYINKNELKKSISSEKNIAKDVKQKDKNISIHLDTKPSCINNENLTKDESNILDKLKENYHKLIDLKKLIDNFKDMFSENKLSLEEWLLKAREFNIPELNSFVNGIKRDIDPVKNSFASRYSNGLLEGMVNKVKEIKRMSYERCRFDLFRLKILNHQGIFG